MTAHPAPNETGGRGLPFCSATTSLRVLFSIVITTAMVATSIPALAQSVFYEGSLRYAQGKYTLDDTVRSAFLLNGFTYSSQRWSAEVVVPVIYQDSGSVLYAGGMPVPGGDHHGDGGNHPGGGHGGPGGMRGDPARPTQDFSDTRLGDPYLRFDALVYRSLFGRNSLGAFGTAKAPLADETRGFGTGEWDFGLGVNWTRRTTSNLLFLELAYWSLGEPENVTYQTPLAAEITYGRVLSNPDYLVEATIWGRTDAATGVDGPIALDVTLGRNLNGPHSIYVTLEAGLTESAPDFALIIGYSSRIWERSRTSD